MKKLLIISSFLLLGLTSCNKEEKSIKQDSLPINKSDSAIYHTFSVDGKPFLVKQIGDNYYISDDVMISKRQLNVIKNIKSSNGGKISSIRKGTHSDFIYKWTNGILYYKIESSRRSQILQAFSMIEAKSNIKFIERTNQQEYVTFIDDSSEGTSYSSHIGMETGANKIVALYPTQGLGTIVHETLHALGYFHEHTRPDRDAYVAVNTSGLGQNAAFQYQKQPYSTSYGNLDFNSIMMYPSSSVMVKVGGGTWAAQRDSLSTGDIEGLNMFYGSKIIGSNNTCSNEIYTILHPNTVTLENAIGVATLTSLGNNKWKVERIGNNSGLVTLKSINADNVISTSTINIGGDFTFTGRPIVNPGQIYTYTVDPSVNNVTFSVGGATILSQTSNTVRIRVLNTASNGALPYVQISATGTSTCGVITKTIIPDVVI
ncbi:M12 family metallopeptidase [Sphingobacterium sp. PCS056]|uniref:M12 family metallopeptidase n=1 Tax=Sphingobacterium sp. PCS056 TaxID=2931400 RepID=UPI00200BF47B|nr:M12 family metallopeptidase [Sphingobacterium sp. PCS056]UPZ35550.1 M12 family metallopeptidase [Sphingobacterium sp. PCS056]